MHESGQSPSGDGWTKRTTKESYSTILLQGSITA
jgi:hypothetical protein